MKLKKRINKPSGNGEIKSIPRVLREPVSKRFEAFESMKCFPEVKERILAGWSSPQIVKFIVDENPEDFDLLNISDGTLKNNIVDYTSSLPSTELIQKRMPDAMVKAVEKVDEGISEITELGDLYNLQKERITMETNTERNIGKLFKGTGNEIKIASDILRAAADLKMDMGLIKRNLGTMEVDQTLLTDFTKKYGRADLANVLANPEKRRRIVSTIELLVNSTKHNPDLMAEIVADGEKAEEEPDDNE